VCGVVAGKPPALDLQAERALQDLVVALADERLIRSAHDCSDGGLAVTLAECCFDTGGIGAEASIDGVDVARGAKMNQAAALFGESASRVLLSVTQDDLTTVLERAAAAGVKARVIGETGGNLLRIAVAGQVVVDVPIEEGNRVWSMGIERHFAKRVA
jgi:phosphoribosylformylglycinamidine synthase